MKLKSFGFFCKSSASGLFTRQAASACPEIPGSAQQQPREQVWGKESQEYLPRGGAPPPLPPPSVPPRAGSRASLYSHSVVQLPSSPNPSQLRGQCMVGRDKALPGLLEQGRGLGLGEGAEGGTRHLPICRQRARGRVEIVTRALRKEGANQDAGGKSKQ